MTKRDYIHGARLDWKWDWAEQQKPRRCNEREAEHASSDQRPRKGGSGVEDIVS